MFWHNVSCSFDSYPDEFESTRIIGEKQFKKAVELFTKANEQLKGKIGYRHSYVDFSKLEVSLPKAGGGTEGVTTCPAAFWKVVRNVLKTPDQEQVNCQHPKPILLDTGEMKVPYDWAVSIQF